MLSMMWKFCKQLADHFKEKIKDLSRPQTASLRVATVSDLIRNRKDLIVENAILRQQLIVLKRQVKRPKFTFKDRLRLVILSRLTPFWREALLLIQPDTLLRWHRDLFRQYWKQLSKSKN